MKIDDWKKFHGFTDEDFERIDTVKKIFGGTIDIIRTEFEYKKEMENISINNKINIDRLWIK